MKSLRKLFIDGASRKKARKEDPQLILIAIHEKGLGDDIVTTVAILFNHGNDTMENWPLMFVEKCGQVQSLEKTTAFCGLIMRSVNL